MNRSHHVLVPLIGNPQHVILLAKQASSMYNFRFHAVLSKNFVFMKLLKDIGNLFLPRHSWHSEGNVANLHDNCTRRYKAGRKS